MLDLIVENQALTENKNSNSNLVTLADIEKLIKSNENLNNSVKNRELQVKAEHIKILNANIIKNINSNLDKKINSKSINTHLEGIFSHFNENVNNELEKVKASIENERVQHNEHISDIKQGVEDYKKQIDRTINNQSKIASSSAMIGDIFTSVRGILLILAIIGLIVMLFNVFYNNINTVFMAIIGAILAISGLIAGIAFVIRYIRDQFF